MPITKSKVQVKSEKVTAKLMTKRSAGLLVPVYSLSGRAAGTLTLPKEVFRQEVNQKLLSQALRVYMTNQKTITSSTKTRGEVQGSTRKIYRQKGTGGARHGARTAPIFVGGGVVFGPTPRAVRLDLPKKMKRSALVSALSYKCREGSVMGVSGLEKSSGKTKEIVKLMSSIVNRQSASSAKRDESSEEKQNMVSALIVTVDKQDNVVRAVRNISGVDVLPASQINAYEVLKHQLLVVTKETVDKLGGKGS